MCFRQRLAGHSAILPVASAAPGTMTKCVSRAASSWAGPVRTRISAFSHVCVLPHMLCQGAMWPAGCCCARLTWPDCHAQHHPALPIGARLCSRLVSQFTPLSTSQFTVLAASRATGAAWLSPFIAPDVSGIADGRVKSLYVSTHTSVLHIAVAPCRFWASAKVRTGGSHTLSTHHLLSQTEFSGAVCYSAL